jgi:hypothetical protein
MNILELDGCITTYSGIKFNLLEPTQNMIRIEDIVKGLSFKGHFAGQTPQFFSIAQHCLLTLALVPEELKRENPQLALAALLHDASEAYIGDMVKPLKVHIPFFKEVEDRIMVCIFERYELDINLMKEIKPYDIQAQQIEYDVFFKGVHVVTLEPNIFNVMSYMCPETAENHFGRAFNYCYGQKSLVKNV